MIWSKLPPGRSVRPMLPAKSVSPAMRSLSGAKCRQIEPWVWPGVCRHLGGVMFQAYGRAIGQGSVGWRGLRGGNTQPFGLLRHHLSSGKSFSFRKMGAPVSRLSLSAPPTWSMWAWVTRICLSLRPKFGQPLVDASNLVAGVDDDGLMCLLVPQEGAVAGQRAYGKCLEDHGYDCSAVSGSKGTRALAPSVPPRRYPPPPPVLAKFFY